jgi:class 3 adenylate cyclase/tetratricopeptide (TPR) repeat protein
MRCSRCRSEVPSDADFCPECGAKLAVACVGCGTTNAARHKFCKKCGEPLPDVMDAGRALGASRSLQESVPKHLAEKILTSRSALEGERKQVTVLFADLKGSMELLADGDPEEARKILDPVLELMMEAVHWYEGTVNQVMGDGIMALFGAPVAHEDHAVRACYAALRMQERVGRYGDETQRSQGIPVQIRVGLNSGEVVVRAIGSDLHMDYTAVGQTTHLAARMEQMAKPGSVLATAHVLRLAEGFIQIGSLGPIPIRGLTEPVEVFEVLGAGPTRTRWQAAASRGLTRFVGRQRELEALGEALERARAGHGQIVAPVGEPGVGKSRLFWEFTRSHRTKGWLVYETGSAPYGKATPYFPIINLLKTYFEIESRDDARKTHAKVLGKLFTLDKAFEPAVPPFLALLDVPVEDPAWQALDPPQRRQRTLDGIKRLLLRESQVQPLLLVIEDLHWIDTETQAVLDTLVESLPTARILLLFNYRPEYQHGWGSKSYYTQLRIDPLPAEGAEALLHALLGDDPNLEPLKQLLVAQTEGNPFFVEESVRTLIETKALVGERGNYRLAKDLPSVQVPATVQAVLASRIDRLPSEQKRLLQSASVIGRDVPFALLQAIGELPEETLRRGLAHLQAGEFLYEKTLFPDLEYTFKHALTHDVVYASLLHDRRRALHARILEAMEGLYPDRLDEQLDRLAHHALRGGVGDKALAYLRQAGTKAATRGAYREAAACFEQALEALASLPQSRAIMEQAVDVRLDLYSALDPLGAVARMLDTLHPAEIVAETIGDQRRLGRVLAQMTFCFWFMSDSDRAVETGERAVNIAAGLGDFGLEIMTNIRLGQAYFLTGDFRRAVHCFERTLEALKGDLVFERFRMPGLPAAHCGPFMGYSLAALGDFVEAIVAAEAGVRVAEAGDHAFSRAVAYRGIGSVHLTRGNVHEAISWLDRGLDLCHKGNFALLLPPYVGSLGRAHTLAGRVAEGLTLLEQATEQSASMNSMGYHVMNVTALSEAYLLAGRLDEAKRSVEHAVKLARIHGQRGVEAEALRISGEMYGTQDPPNAEQAEYHYRQAVMLATELGMRPLVAHCHLGLGKLYRSTGKRQEAQKHLTTAATMYREMGMSFWLEKAEAELKSR